MLNPQLSKLSKFGQIVVVEFDVNQHIKYIGDMQRLEKILIDMEVKLNPIPQAPTAHTGNKPPLHYIKDVIVKGGIYLILIDTATDKCVGQCYGKPLLHYVQTISLCMFVVDPTYRGNGLGHTMLTAYKDIAKKRKFKFVQLRVLADNDAAIRLYSRSGFTVDSLSMFSAL